jgi:hypothetical protein
VSGDWGRGEERRRGAVSAVQRDGRRGVFYRAEEVVVRRGGGQWRWRFTPRWF